jgi:ribokinase
MGTFLDAKVVDTTAAGDTFIGYFLSSYVKNKNIQECLLRATMASSLCVGKPGAASSIPLGADVDNAITNNLLGKLY